MGFQIKPALLVATLLCNTAWAEDPASLRLSRNLPFKPTPSTPQLNAAEREALNRQLPPAPEGLVWTLYRNIVFLKPEPWEQNEKDGSITGVPASAWAASPEAFSDGKPFETGATIQIIRNPQKMRRIDARQMALAYLKPFIDSTKREDILQFEKSMKGDVEYTSLRLRDAPPGLKPVIVHKLLIADSAGDMLHVLTFESPVETWDANWAKFGTPFMTRARVLPGVPAS